VRLKKRIQKVRFDDNVVTIPIPAVGLGQSWYCSPTEIRPYTPIRAPDVKGAGACDAIARARGLAAQVSGSADGVRWPVWWFEDEEQPCVYVWQGRTDGFVTVDEL